MIVDVIQYYQQPTVPDLICIFGNQLWRFVSPWIAGYTMVSAYSEYQVNPSLYSFLGYTVDDFFVMQMNQQKMAFANKYSY